MAALPSFTVVYIPTDVTEPLAEWSIPIPPGREVECLTSRLKEHYIATGPALSADAAARHASSLLEQAGTSAASVSDETLRAMAQMQLVESVPLLPGGASTNQTHVNLYVDDSGVAKNLPLNERACGLCAACGTPREVRGDAFVGRLVDDGADRFERLSFSLSELDSSATWVKEAQRLHADRANQLSRVEEIAGMSGATVVDGMTNDDGGGGGGSGEMYTWEQNKEEVTVTVKCPLTTKAKDVKCKIAKQKLLLDVATVDKPDGKKDDPIIDAALFQECVVDDSAWTLETESDHKNVVVTLTKGVSIEGKPMRWLMLTR